MTSKCEARQFSDMMYCKRCNVGWDVNDPLPPDCCPTFTARQRDVLREMLDTDFDYGVSERAAYRSAAWDRMREHRPVFTARWRDMINQYRAADRYTEKFKKYHLSFDLSDKPSETVVYLVERNPFTGDLSYTIVRDFYQQEETSMPIVQLSATFDKRIAPTREKLSDIALAFAAVYFATVGRLTFLNQHDVPNTWVRRILDELVNAGFIEKVELPALPEAEDYIARDDVDWKLIEEAQKHFPINILALTRPKTIEELKIDPIVQHVRSARTDEPAKGE